MRSFLSAAVAVALLAPFAHAEASEVGRGTILVGSPTTLVVPVEDVTSFFIAAPAAGTVISTVTTDHGGLGYDIDIYFYTASGAYISACASEGTEEVGCVVPTGAAEIEVSAFFGFDLEVSVVA